MLVVKDISSFRAKPSYPIVLALGNFDGVHIGHQKLISQIVGRAQQLKGRSAVLTFEEHPQSVLQPSKKLELLTSPEHKLCLLEKLKLDICFLASFTTELSRLEPETFVKDILVDRLHVREVYLGFNAHFGRDRKGDGRLMEQLASRFEFHFQQIPPVEIGDDFVSSSLIRNLVRAGELLNAEACLGRPYSFFGKVIHGEGRGKGLGFPTANLDTNHCVLPPEGVYPISVKRVSISKKASGTGTEEFHVAEQSQQLQGVLNYGRRPTFKGGIPEAVAEVFILDFQGDLYGQLLEVTVYPQLRKEKAFPDLEALKAQIREDISRTRQFFAGLGQPKNSFTKIAS